MRVLFFTALIFTAVNAISQNSYLYEFNGKFDEASGNGPRLTTLGETGKFITDNLPELGNVKRKVYRFQKNSGLNYNISNSRLKLYGSYSIELYFKFDALDSWKRVIDFKNRTTDNGVYIFNGKLNFYKIITSDISPVVPNEYTHYIITYDAATRMVNMYADGVCKITFFDEYGDARADSGELHFFYDDLVVKNEASSGTVAFVKLFDYTLTPEKAKYCYENLRHTIHPELVLASPVQAKPAGPTVLTVSIININTGQPVIATVTIKRISAPENSLTLPQVSEIHQLLSKGNYLLHVKAKGYAETNIEIKAGTLPQTLNEIIKLTPIEIGVNVKLENVHFRQGFSDLLKESFPVLDHLVKLLKDNENMQIELSGHTDNQGHAKLNQILSEERVHTILKYLMEHGISKSRVTGKGYGDKHPVVPNDNEANRKLNRRVEIKVLKI